MPEEIGRRYANVRATIEKNGRDPSEVTMSLMHTILVGSDEDDLRDRARRMAEDDEDFDGDLDAYVKVLDGSGAIVGTPERAAERLSAFAERAWSGFMLQHLLHEDTEMLEIFAREVIPKVG
jgi:alkanesulfonate monooxygenase SsuD/methylene tetrahydromethanopterin reductase-like flavin-dependent oxidoreductase (luciferase family)